MHHLLRLALPQKAEKAYPATKLECLAIVLGRRKVPTLVDVNAI